MEEEIMQAEFQAESIKEEKQLQLLEEKEKNEIWQDIKGYEGLYQISNFGRVKSLKRDTKNQFMNKEKIKKLYISNSGYLTVVLFKKNKSKHYLIHRLVAQIFIPNFKKLPQVNHKDGNKLNNNINNLEWCDRSTNIKHAYKNKLEIPNYKNIIQYSKEGKFIKEWEGINLASKQLKINRSNIIRVCKQDTNRKFAGGFIWRYKEVN